MHIAQIGTGRGERPLVYTIISTEIADTPTVYDVRPTLAAAFAYVLKHVTASLKSDVEIKAYDRDEKLNAGNFILIPAGKPHTLVVEGLVRLEPVTFGS